MATAKCVIRTDKKNKAGECLIFVLYTHNGKSAKFSTGEKIAPEHWDSKKGQVKKSYGRGYITFNDTLKTKLETIETIKRLAIQRSIDPGLEYVKKEFEKIKPGKISTDDLFKLYENFLAEKEPKVTYNTIRDHRITLNHLRNFQQVTKYKVTLESVNLSFYNKAMNYLIGELKHSPNTVAKFVKNLRTFLNYLTEHGLNTNLAYKSFKKPKHITDIITLNKAELDTIFTVDLSTNPRLDRVRDLFIFSCVTGLRFSDMANLKPENIKPDALELTTIKTHQHIIIPLNSYSTFILQKYNGLLPKVLTNQRMNVYIKELGKLCSIDQPVEVIKYIGSQRIAKTSPKYELMSTHLGRRTFITLCLEKGMLPKEIMQLTGHTDTEMLLRYFNKDKQEVRAKAMQLWNDAPSVLKVS